MNYFGILSMKSSLLMLLICICIQVSANTKHISDALRTDLTPVECMALNIYHESRNEFRLGMGMVAQVTMNRVRHSNFPNDVCSVVLEPRQFSWTHDGKSDHPFNDIAYARSIELAILFVELNHVVDLPNSDKLLFYHADYVYPKWDGLLPIYVVGTHIFYVIKSEYTGDKP